MPIRTIGISVLLCFFCALSGLGQAQTLSQDEDVIVFPSFAYEGKDQTVHLSFHAWVFEPEPDSLWRQSLVRSLKPFFPAGQTPEESRTLQRRLHGFTSDNERHKKLQVRLGSQTLDAGTTGSDGHVQTEWNLTLPGPDRAALEAGQLSLGWDKGGQAKPLWIPRQGLSVVSDIDDTIKITQVLDRKALIANSFCREFQPVPGMPDLYKKLANQAAVFHYVSASPWQLYPDLQEFVSRHFPSGTLSLRKLRWKDSSGIDFLWSDSMLYKTSTIAELMQRFPERKFLLVGDSGEKDPDVYETIRKRFPKQIVGILIRIPPEQKTTKRKAGMEYFRDVADAEKALKRWGL
ncbi:MAG: DUF2183 domain-containing protein [Pseudobdellovibrionaceae bacterium]|nr:DUF2183 domain-containing protein [Pseudobdellovibrionaceae bacterium]